MVSVYWEGDILSKGAISWGGTIQRESKLWLGFNIWGWSGEGASDGVKRSIKNLAFRASLMAQWQRTLLPTQETQVWSLIQEDPTCHKVTKPVCHRYQVCAPEPVSRNYWRPSALEPVLHNERVPRSPQLETVPCSPQLETVPRSPLLETVPRSPLLEKSGNKDLP